MLAAALVIACARPVWLSWSRRFAYTIAVICAGGILAAQSRQAIIGALVGIFIVAARPRLRAVKRGRVIFLVLLGAAASVFVLANVNEQLASGNQYNSANQRVSWYEESVRIWMTSPLFGVGMRWWYTDRFPEKFQPPNAELEVLTTTGVVGLIGFLVMFAAAAWLLLRMDPVYGTVGVAIIATRFVQAQFDLYWVAGQASLLWIIAGICYGVRERDRALGIDRVALAEAAAQGPPTGRRRPIAARAGRPSDGASS
nr:O-antigen ligase family protein [Agromyces seonyuensis]